MLLENIDVTTFRKLLVRSVIGKKDLVNLSYNNLFFWILVEK